MTPPSHEETVAMGRAMRSRMYEDESESAPKAGPSSIPLGSGFEERRAQEIAAIRRSEKLPDMSQRVGTPKAEAPKVCGVVGLPNGEKKVCELEAGHADDYHRDGTTRWIGYWPKAEAPMTREELATCILRNVSSYEHGAVRTRALELIDRFALSIAAAARKEAEEERDAVQRSLVEQGAILDWVMDAVSGQEPVSDFAESFPAVRQAQEWRRQAWQQGNEHAALIYAERDKEWERKVKSAEHSRQALAEALRDLIDEEGNEPTVEHEHFNAPGIRCPRCLIVKALTTHGQDR